MGSAQRSLICTVFRARARLRGTVSWPCHRTVDHRRSSAIIWSGSPATWLWNQMSIAGVRSSSIQSCSVRNSRIRSAGSSMAGSWWITLVLIGAPGESCRAKRISIARRARLMVLVLQPCWAAWSRMRSSRWSTTGGSAGGGKPARLPAWRSRGRSINVSWRWATGRGGGVNGWRAAGRAAGPTAGARLPRWCRLARNSCCPWRLASVMLRPVLVQRSDAAWRQHSRHTLSLSTVISRPQHLQEPGSNLVRHERHPQHSHLCLRTTPQA